MPLAPAEINIKNHIIKYPLLFQSRMDVLKHVLIRDPESEWLPDGTILSRKISLEDDPAGKIDLPDFPISGLKSNQSITNQIIVSKLKIIEENFDFVVANTMEFEKPFTTTDLHSLNNYSLLFNLPENIESSWKKAVVDLTDVSIIVLRNEYCKNNCSGHSVDDWTYPMHFEQFKKLKDIQKKFLPTISPEVAEKLKNLANLLQ